MCNSNPSSNTVSGPRPTRYLIGSAANSSLQAVAPALLSDPEVKIRQFIGPQDNPAMIVAEMTPEHATLLQAQFAGQAIIEEDAEVFPTGGAFA